MSFNPSIRRNQERIEANAEHRRREDAAARLRDVVPQLVTLRLHFEERRDTGKLIANAYAKPIVIASAPARFEISCMEPQCDGRHDLTSPIMNALRAELPAFSSESRCDGYVADRACDRALVYSLSATYAAMLR